MFKKSQRRIVAAVMATLIFALAGVFAVIFLASYSDVRKESLEMLEKYAELYFKNGEPDNAIVAQRRFPGVPETGDMPAGLPDGAKPESGRLFALSTFYAVSFDKNGKANPFDNDGSSPYSDERLSEMARKCLGHETGTTDGLIFLTKTQGDTTLVVFKDDTIKSDTMATLFRYTVIFGAAALLVLFALSVLMSKKIIEPLRKNDEKQRQFVSDAGHELKTPVSVIDANAELLAREIGPNKWLDNIRFENARMEELTRQLLELARTEQTKPVFAEFDMSRTVTGCILPFEGVAFDKGITLAYSIEPGITCCGSREQIGELTTVLIDNAMAHSAGGGEITVELKRHKGSATLSVANPGEPIEDRERIFERFYKSDEARSENGAHYGLGLAIAKAIVKAHGGTITVESKGGMNIFCAELNVLQ